MSGQPNRPELYLQEKCAIQDELQILLLMFFGKSATNNLSHPWFSGNKQKTRYRLIVLFLFCLFFGRKLKMSHIYPYGMTLTRERIDHLLGCFCCHCCIFKKIFENAFLTKIRNYKRRAEFHVFSKIKRPSWTTSTVGPLCRNKTEKKQQNQTRSAVA